MDQALLNKEAQNYFEAMEKENKINHSDTEIKEEEKYTENKLKRANYESDVIEITRSKHLNAGNNLTINLDSYNNTDNDFEKKYIRSKTEIDNYLKQYIPPYTHFSVFKSILFIAFLILNVYGIISNFVEWYTKHNESKYHQIYLLNSNMIIICFEFIGLCILSCSLLISLIIYRDASMIINYLIKIKTWSAFKLFYKFRPLAVYQNVAIFYKQQSETVYNDDSNKTKLEKIKYIVKELNDQIFLTNVNKQQMINTCNILTTHINQKEMLTKKK
eukprot:221721_1